MVNRLKMAIITPPFFTLDLAADHLETGHRPGHDPAYLSRHLGSRNA